MKFLYEKDNIIYSECEECGYKLKFKSYQVNEIKDGIRCFCGNISNVLDGYTVKSNVSTPTTPEVMRSISSLAPTYPTRVVPRCPTCSSTNIQKISLTSKAIGGAAFGIFSSNIRNTMKCKNCGYKW